MGEGNANPVLVEVTRGRAVESRHRGAAVAVDAGGAPVAAWGDVAARVLPRSAVKPLQALALVESGAAAAYSVSEAEFALACASHAGEPRHVEVVAAWLARLGLAESDLACGGHMPGNEAAGRALVVAGKRFGRLHDNCSGKHSGMLTLARHLGAPTKGYERADHPVQRRIVAVLSDLAGARLGARDAATDGCGVPTYPLPLAGLARAWARFGTGAALGPARAEAAARLRAAIAANPVLVAGSGRLDSEVVAASAGRVLVKVGAEGVYAGAIPAAGLGIALKIDDGARRAAEVACVALLDRLGALDDEVRRELAGWRAPKVVTRAGEVVGEIRAVL